MKTLNAAALSHAVLCMSLVESAVYPLNAQMDHAASDDTFTSEDGPPGRTGRTVLYEGPMVHDREWIMRRGTDKNQVLPVFGGNCSLIPSDVRNNPDSARERVSFEATNRGLGLWSMKFADQVTGRASADSGQQYRYVYINEVDYLGTTTNGRAPLPSRSTPSSDSPGFMQFVPSNVNAPVVHVTDMFVLQDATTGKLVAYSSFRWIERLPNSPSEQPPAVLPIIDQGYIVDLYQQLAGQLGCDGF